MEKEGRWVDSYASSLFCPQEFCEISKAGHNIIPQKSLLEPFCFVIFIFILVFYKLYYNMASTNPREEIVGNGYSNII
jgi:hypothetical protein